ncbi:MAG: ORF6N domain-containing protein [Candidatus Margulisiibacteriota bacterium]
MSKLIPVERIENKIFLIRGQKVILDRDLAVLYGVATRDLNKAVTRNIYRFPEDFMFELTQDEFKNLKFQFGTSSWGGTRKLPKAFTEQGIAMLSSVLHSKRAIEMNILIVRAFVKLRQVLANHQELALKFKELEQKVGQHDTEILAICKVIKKMLVIESKPKRKIGFITDKNGCRRSNKDA